MDKIIDYILIVFGSCIAIYAQAGEKQNVYLLIIGIVCLMIGLYRLASKIPSKNNENFDEKDI